jgi:hypothetical protein
MLALQQHARPGEYRSRHGGSGQGHEGSGTVVAKKGSELADFDGNDRTEGMIKEEDQEEEEASDFDRVDAMMLASELSSLQGWLLKVSVVSCHVTASTHLSGRRTGLPASQ